MIFVTGGLASGKRAYVRSLGYDDTQMLDGALGELPVVLNAQELVREGQGGKDADVSTLVEALAAKDVVTCVEMGCGVVPLDHAERDWRDRTGMLACSLAERATKVVRLVCGVPVTLKDDAKPKQLKTTPAVASEAPLDSVELVIMRHGATKGNEERRYVGAVDAPLTPLGCAQAVTAGIHPEVDRVYVTTLQRSQQTAAICFPCAEQIIVDGLQEMDFGVFAGRSADEMVDDPEYRAWVDGNCEGQCPQGESRAQAMTRISRAMGKLILNAQKAGERRVILVAHGGTMMAALDRHAVDNPGRDYWSWNVPNCEGYVLKAQVTKGGTFTLAVVDRFSNLDFLG